MRATHSPGKWKLAERLASELDVEYGTDVKRLLDMPMKELERRKKLLEGESGGFRPISRKTEASKGLLTVEKDP